ncbi:MAG: flagellar basal-body rod protein FlgF [Bacillota bacterium]
MVRGIYVAASGMVAGMLQQDVIAQNLANVDTPGYKKDVALMGSFAHEMAMRVEDRGARCLGSAVPIGLLGSGAFARGVGFDPREGPMIETGGTFDLAIQGDGYFVVATPDGEAYTRNGAFTLNAKGELTTADGMLVLGEGGAITVPSGTRVDVWGNGAVVVDGKPCGRLRIVCFEEPSGLRKVGGGLFAADAGTAKPAASAAVRQGFLEMSNVNAVTEMVRMIAGMRAYEACQKVIWFLDQTLDKAVNDVGRVA